MNHFATSLQCPRELCDTGTTHLSTALGYQINCFFNIYLLLNYYFSMFLAVLIFILSNLESRQGKRWSINKYIITIKVVSAFSPFSLLYYQISSDRPGLKEVPSWEISSGEAREVLDGLKEQKFHIVHYESNAPKNMTSDLWYLGRDFTEQISQMQ